MELKNITHVIGIAMIFLLALNWQTVDASLTLDSRIINGTQVSWNSTRYQVSIRFKSIDKNFFGMGHECAGTIIARDLVLTAAHCIWNNDTQAYRSPIEFLVVMGNIDRMLQNSNTLALDVKKIITSDSFHMNTYKNDIAVMFLNQTIPETYQSAEILDINTNSDVADNTLCTVTGWGITEKGTFATKLMSVQVPIINRTLCSINYGKGFITKEMLCAGYMQGGKDACSADSGGPMVCNNKLAGIVSFSFGCAAPGFPGVYTNVGYHLDWLRQNTNLTFSNDNEVTATQTTLPFTASDHVVLTTSFESLKQNGTNSTGNGNNGSAGLSSVNKFYLLIFAQFIYCLISKVL